MQLRFQDRGIGKKSPNGKLPIIESNKFLLDPELFDENFNREKQEYQNLVKNQANSLGSVSCDNLDSLQTIESRQIQQKLEHNQLIKEKQNQKKRGQHQEIFDKVFQNEVRKNLEAIDIEKEEQSKRKGYKNKEDRYLLDRIQKLEEKVTKAFQEQNYQDSNYLQVVELRNLYLKKDPKRAQIEILNGRYNLCINKELPFKKKIQQFANEPMAYYLFKKRDFVQRLEHKELNRWEKEEIEFEELIKRLIQDSSGIRNKKFEEYIQKIRLAIQIRKQARLKLQKKLNVEKEDQKAFEELDQILTDKPEKSLSPEKKEKRPLEIIMQQIKLAKEQNLQQAIEKIKVKQNQDFNQNLDNENTKDNSTQFQRSNSPLLKLSPYKPSQDPYTSTVKSAQNIKMNKTFQINKSNNKTVKANLKMDTILTTNQSTLFQQKSLTKTNYGSFNQSPIIFSNQRFNVAMQLLLNPKYFKYFPIYPYRQNKFENQSQNSPYQTKTLTKNYGTLLISRSQTPNFVERQNQNLNKLQPVNKKLFQEKLMLNSQLQIFNQLQKEQKHHNKLQSIQNQSLSLYPNEQSYLINTNCYNPAKTFETRSKSVLNKTPNNYDNSKLEKFSNIMNNAQMQQKSDISLDSIFNTNLNLNNVNTTKVIEHPKFSNLTQKSIQTKQKTNDLNITIMNIFLYFTTICQLQYRYTSLNLDYNPDSYLLNKSNLQNILSSCKKSQLYIKKNLKTFDSNLHDTHQFINSFYNVSQTMKEIENAPADKLGTTYIYQKVIQKDQQKQEQQTSYEFKVAQVDPFHMINKWERKVHHKKGF